MFNKIVRWALCGLFLGAISFAYADESTNTTTGQRYPIQTWQTRTGIPVYFIVSPNLPMVDIAVVANAGSAQDGNKYGLANLVGQMLNQGTDRLNAQQIASGFENLGAEYNASTSQDMAVFTLRSLTRADVLNPALQLFNQVLTHPSFPLDRLNNEKQLISRSIQGDQQDPDTVANQAFFQLLYGNHPYGHDPNGTLESVAQLKQADAVTFYKRYFNARNLSVAMVGALTVDQAKQLAEQVTMGIPQGQPAPAIQPIKQPFNKQLEQISFPSNQSFIRLGEIGINLDDPDYFPLTVGNYILGGGVTSRLFDTVREKKGFSYYINSLLIPLAANGPMMVALQTRSDQTSAALNLTRDLIRTYLQAGPTPDEVNAAKNYFIGSFPVRLSSNGALLNFLVSTAFYHRPLNYLDTYPQHIQAVTAEQIHAAFGRHFSFNSMPTIIVGSLPQPPHANTPSSKK